MTVFSNDRQPQVTPEHNDQDSPEDAIGRIVSVNGSQAIVLLAHARPGSGKVKPNRTDMGTLLRVDTPTSMVLGLVSAQSVPAPNAGSDGAEIRIVEMDLVGEIVKNEAGIATAFQRGVSHYPALGDLVFSMTSTLLKKAYMSNKNCIHIGAITQDEDIPATVLIDELLGKHFAVLGTTGTGKSCAVALTLNSILNVSPNAHILLIDPHSEYAPAFEGKAEIITPEDLDLPYWLFTFKEFSEVVFGAASDTEEEIDILAELIPLVKARFSANKARLSDRSLRKEETKDSPVFSVDTPSPYRISDLLEVMDQRMGSLELRNSLIPYRRLKSRIETLSIDPRYAFMFGRAAAQDQMANILGRLFRIPVDSRPIAIAELTGLPAETVNVLVSVICRLAFDFARRSGGKVPITIVCEEAHRYIPTDHELGFEPTRRAIARIAKEGRKYGISLCVVSQRPGELDSTILSQCNTIFALRLANEQDQKIVSSAVSDTTGSLLEFLPALGEREVIAFGDGVSLPMRFKFNELPAHALPKGKTANFSDQWRGHAEDHSFVEAVVNRWRNSLSGDVEPDHTDRQPAPEQIPDQMSGQTEGADLHSSAPQSAAPQHSSSYQTAPSGQPLAPSITPAPAPEAAPAPNARPQFANRMVAPPAAQSTTRPPEQPATSSAESAGLAALANKVARRVSEQTTSPQNDISQANTQQSPPAAAMSSTMPPGPPATPHQTPPNAVRRPDPQNRQPESNGMAPRTPAPPSDSAPILPRTSR